MMAIDVNELWKQIPPEEKLEMMSRAHAQGIAAAAVSIIILCTIAIGLRLSMLMWAAFLFAPFIFQFAAGKAWRGYRPKMLLEFLAARSAARRYAFANNAKDLNLTFMCKGQIQEVFEREDIQEALEAAIANTSEAEVWVALFADAIVMMAERTGGAELRFASVLNDRLSVDSKDLDGKGEYSQNKELYLTLKPKLGPSRRVKLTSRYPAALIVLEKKMKSQQAEVLAKISSEPITPENALPFID